MLTITEPIKTVNGLLTKALAARTQLLYSMQRRDYEVTLITGNQVDILDTTGILVDDTVYVGGIVATVSVVNATGVALSESPDPSGTYLNDFTSRDNYRIDIQILDGAIVLFDNTFTYIPNQSGLLNLDVGSILTTYIITSTGFSKQYLLRVTESWEGSAELPVDTSILQAVLASKQLLSVGGANMWENLLREKFLHNFSGVLDNAGFAELNLQSSYGDITDLYVAGQEVFVNFDSIYNSQLFTIDSSVFAGGSNTRVRLVQSFLGTSEGDASPQANIEAAKFLTKFTNPVKWTGWNRTISALLDSDYNIRTGFSQLTFAFNDADINKITIGSTVTTGTQILTPPRVIIWTIPEKVEIDSSYRRVNMRGDGGLNTTTALYYKLEEPCQNPIMLDWINSKGGIDQWLFENSQTIQVVSDSGVVAESPINTDIEFITRTKRRFSTSFKQQITMRARKLTTDQVLALQEIKQTESLRVYLSKDGSSFIDGIIITSFTTDYTTGDSLHDFVVVVELPDGFIFEEGKLY